MLPQLYKIGYSTYTLVKKSNGNKIGICGLYDRNGIEGIEEITSSSSENISRITVKTYAGFNIDEILQEIKNSVDAIYSFPEGAEKPTIQKQKSRGMGGMGNTVGFYALNGPDDLWSLKEKSDQIELESLTHDENFLENWSAFYLKDKEKYYKDNKKEISIKNDVK